MTNEEILSKYNKLTYAASCITEELDLLRSQCRHEEYSIMYYSYRVGCQEPKRFCKFCSTVIDSTPTREELLSFFREELERAKDMWDKNYPGMEYPKSFEDEHIRKVNGYCPETIAFHVGWSC